MSTSALPKTVRYLTTAEVSEHYRTSPSTIRFWRHKGHGPRGVKVGTRVLYDVAEIERYDRELASQMDGDAA